MQRQVDMKGSAVIDFAFQRNRTAMIFRYPLAGRQTNPRTSELLSPVQSGK